MQAQDRLFCEDINEAIREIVNGLGGPKKVGPLLWPEKTIDQSHSLLLACLNPERKERLTPEQVMLLLREGRAVGCHVGVNFICDQAGYERPAPIEPEDELSKMLREYLDIEHRRAQLQPRIEEARVRLAK